MKGFPPSPRASAPPTVAGARAGKCRKRQTAGPLTESLGPVVAGSVLAEFENTALYALRDFASSGGTAKEVWYGSSGPSSVHPVGLTGGYPQVCDNLRCARNVQASTQKRSSCKRFNGVCPLEKKKASLSPRAPISVEVLPVVVASSPASPVCGLWGCVCCCSQAVSHSQGSRRSPSR